MRAASRLVSTPVRWRLKFKLPRVHGQADRKSTRLNSSHLVISYAVFCLKIKTLLDSQQSGLLRDAVQIPGARLFLDDRTLSTVVDPPAASIARLDLDLALWDSAERAGVH